jgi:hypothetical protein
MAHCNDDESHAWLEDGYAARRTDLVLILIGKFTGFSESFGAR